MSRNVATFVGASSERLILNDPALRYGDEDVTLACWVRAGVVSAVMGLMGRWGGAGSRSYSLYLDATGVPTFAVSNDGTASASVAWSAEADDSAWHFIIAIHDAAANLLKISMDGGAFQTQAHATGIYSGATAEFQIGARGSADFYTGDMASGGAWAKAFSLAQATALHNNETPKLHADLTADELVSLTAYWDLTEASGDRNEQGSSTLTARAGNFVRANSEWLSSSSATLYQSGNQDFTWSTWFFDKPDPGNAHGLMSIYGAAGNLAAILFVHGAIGDPWVGLSTDGTAVTFKAWTTGVRDGLWHQAIFVHDGVDDLLKISVDGGTYKTAAFAGGVFAGSADDFLLAAFTAGGGGNSLNGRQMTSGVWSKAFSQAQATALYNAGTTLAYSDLTADQLTGLVEYWDVDEQSGSRVGSHAAINLTDVNTVTYAQAKGQLWLLDVNTVGSSVYAWAPAYQYTGSGVLVLGGSATAQRLLTPFAEPGDDPHTVALTASDGDSTLTDSAHTTTLTGSGSYPGQDNEMGTFYLKYRDTEPLLEVALKNPDGTAFDLTSSTAWELHIWLSDGTKLTRTMTVYGAATNGILRYQWLTTDWDTGNLVASPTLPLSPSDVDHRMEYEVLTASGRITFPNDGYDVLRVTTDIGQAT